MSPKKEQNYQRFAGYAKYTTDAHWKKIFDLMSTGKFPSGFFLSPKGETLISEDGRKLKLKPDGEKVAELDNASAIRIFIEGKNENDKVEKSTSSEWKSIKSKETKNHLIFAFAKKKIDELGVGPQQEKRLAEQIGLCLQLKNIEPSDVVMKDGKIKTIKGITILKTGELKMPPIKIPKKTNTTKKKRNVLRFQIEKMIKENQQRLEKLSC